MASRIAGAGTGRWRIAMSAIGASSRLGAAAAFIGRRRAAERCRAARAHAERRRPRTETSRSVRSGHGGLTRRPSYPRTRALGRPGDSLAARVIPSVASLRCLVAAARRRLRAATIASTPPAPTPADFQGIADGAGQAGRRRSTTSCRAMPGATIRSSSRPRSGSTPQGLDQAESGPHLPLHLPEPRVVREAARDHRQLRPVVRDRPADVRDRRAVAVRAGRPGSMGARVRGGHPRRHWRSPPARGLAGTKVRGSYLPIADGTSEPRSGRALTGMLGSCPPPAIGPVAARLSRWSPTSLAVSAPTAALGGEPRRRPRAAAPRGRPIAALATRRPPARIVPPRHERAPSRPHPAAPGTRGRRPMDRPAPRPRYPAAADDGLERRPRPARSTARRHGLQGPQPRVDPGARHRPVGHRAISCSSSPTRATASTAGAAPGATTSTCSVTPTASSSRSTTRTSAAGSGRA